MNSIRFVGLDVHRESVRACIRDPEGHIVAEMSLGCTREELESFAKSRLTHDDVVVLEATFHTWAIVDVLGPHVARVVVSNPMATKAMVQSKIKTDKVDARSLSELLRSNSLPLVWAPDAKTRDRRTACARRSGLVSDLVRIKNRIHGALAKALVPKRRGDLFDRSGRAWLASLELPDWARAQIDSDLRFLALAERELQEHDKTLVLLAWDDPRVKLLMTMPGVDMTVALAVIAVLGDIDRFGDGEHLAAYLGLVPTVTQSGNHCYYGHITKRGNGRARWLLIQAAQHLAKHPGPLGVFFRRLASRKNRNVAVVATARKLAVIAWHMLRNNEPYRYAQPAPTANKLSRLRVRATGARRRTGPAKGSAQPGHRGTGQRTRTVQSLKAIYSSEGLPETTPAEKLKAAEIRTLQQQRIMQFVEELQREHSIPRNRRVAAQTDRFVELAGRACIPETPRAPEQLPEPDPHATANSKKMEVKI
jgi:transposase